MGPTTLEDLARRIGRTGESYLVWTQGMAGWTDAETVPAVSRLLHPTDRSSVAAPEHGKHSRKTSDASRTTALKRRLGRELFEYITISIYLLVCFGALLFYKSAILRNDGIEFAPFGIAVVKALILGKFVLILHALKIGERNGGRGVLITDILKKSIVFLIFLSFLAVLEEIIVGLFHGREVREVVREIGGGTVREALATGVLLLLILIPYFTFRVVSLRLGEGVLWKLLTERGPITSP